MSIIKSNIVQMWRAKHSFFIVVILVQAIAAFSVLYVSGAIANDYLYLKENAYTNLDLYIPLDLMEDNPVHYSQVKDVVFEICNNCIPGVVEDVALYAPYSEKYGLIISVVGVEGDRYTLTDTTNYNIKGTLSDGRVFTEEELNDEGYYALVADLENEEIVIDGKSFEVVGEMGGFAGIPEVRTTPYAFESLDLQTRTINFTLKRIITEKELAEIEGLLDEVVPGTYEIVVETSTDEDQRAILKSSLVTSFLIGMSVLAVLIIVYGYIINLRKKNLAIWRLTGCSSIKAAGLFFIEMGIISAPSVLLGFTVFYIMQKMWLNELYPYMSVTLTAELYVKLYVSIIVMLFVLFAGISLFNSRHSVKQQLIRANI